MKERVDHKSYFTLKGRSCFLHNLNKHALQHCFTTPPRTVCEGAGGGGERRQTRKAVPSSNRSVMPASLCFLYSEKSGRRRETRAQPKTAITNFIANKLYSQTADEVFTFMFSFCAILKTILK